MDALTQLVGQASDFLWNVVLIIILCGTGIYYTIRLKFIQVRKFKEGWHQVFGNFSLRGKKGNTGEMTSFQSVATAIAAQVGTGNLAGAATALIGGGPGAIFWMSFSICTKEMWCMEISAWQTWCMTAAGQRLSILDSPGMLTGTVCVSAWIMQDLQMCCCIFCIPDIPGTGRNPGMRHFHCLMDRKIICRKC